MMQISIDASTTARWIVCDTRRRWVDAARRFAPTVMPSTLTASVASCEPSRIGDALVRGNQAVLLWGVHRATVVDACDWIAGVSLKFPQTLQLLAAEGLHDRELAVLCELGCRATIRHPEQLPRLKTMIHGYFASTSQILD